jgi:hypothetical protein
MISQVDVRPKGMKVPLPGPAVKVPPKILNRYIEGGIAIEGNCAATASELILDVSDARRSWVVRAQNVPHSFSFRYRLDELPAGRYTVTPRSLAARCPGGAWMPNSAIADLSRGVRVVRDFRYSSTMNENRLDMGVVSGLIQEKFRGTQIRLTNYRPSDRISYVRLGPDLGGREFQFTIPEYRNDPFRYYVNDINLSNIVGGYEGGAIRLRFLFEEAGVELKGRCRGGFPICLAGPDDTAPDAHIRGLQVDVLLTPAMFTGARGSSADLSFGDVTVRAKMRLDIRGICDVVPCGEVERFAEREIKRQVEEAVRKMIDTREVRAVVAGALRPSLDRLRIGTIQGVYVEGRSLVIRHIPRPS